MTIAWKIVSGKGAGMGSFLCPPGDPHHYYHVENTREGTLLSLSGALDDSSVSPVVKERVRTLLDGAERTYSELWIRGVYGYFRSMYVPESGSRAVSDLISDRANTLPVERHAAVAFIRDYFPVHAPRVDLIMSPGKGYGSYPCVHCGERVQYEPKADALARITPTGGIDKACPSDDSGHAVDPATGASTVPVAACASDQKEATR